MIEFDGVSAGTLREASFAVPAGTVAGLVTPSGADTDRIVSLLVGGERPVAGSVRLLGRPVADLPEAEALALLARCAVLWPDGGLVSNLKAWENILLPLWYHGNRRAAEREGEVLEILERLGVPKERMPHLLQALPGRLDVRERRIVGIARSLLREPEVLVFAGQLEELDEGACTRIREAARWHHGRHAAATTLWVTSDERTLEGTGATLLLRQKGDGRVTA